MLKLPILMFILLQGCSVIYDWQTKYPDNLAEEAIEDFILDKTGVDADLTPFTGDEKQTLNPTGK